MSELVAPIIPSGQDNKSPQILLEGLRTGLAFFSQAAQNRRQTESDIAHLALQEKMASEAHDLDQQKINLASEMVPYEKRLKEAQADLASEHATAFADGTATAAQNKIRYNRQKQVLFNEINDTTKKLQLDDPNFQTKEPMAFAANVMKFKDMYGLAPMTEVQGAIKKYQSIADSQRIVIRPNAVRDANGAWVTGEPRNVPIWKIAKNLQDPDAREQTMNDLRASGHITETEENVPGTPGKIFGSWWPDAPTTKKVEKRSQAMDRLLQNKTEFQHEKSRVPAVMMPSSSSQGTAPTALPAETDETAPAPAGVDGADPTDLYSANGKQPDYGPDMEATRKQAVAALRRGASPKAVTERWQGMGFDPASLWTT